MDIRDADPRAHLYGMEEPRVMWRAPKSRLDSWVAGSRHIIVNRTSRARSRLAKLLLLKNKKNNGRENQSGSGSMSE